MARKSVVVLILFLIMSSIFLASSSSTHARKLLTINEQHNKSITTPTLFDRLYLGALPKGKVPVSAPSKKGHAATTEEKLIARNLRAIDRILFRSVPSPGDGN